MPLWHSGQFPFIYPDGEAGKGYWPRRFPLGVTLRRFPMTSPVGMPQRAFPTANKPPFSRNCYRPGRECPLWHSGGSPLSTPMVEARKGFWPGRFPWNHPPAVPHFITDRNATAGIPYG